MMTPLSLNQDLRDIITGLFPDSHLSVGLSTGVGRMGIRVVFAYRTKDRCRNGILENDRAFHTISIGAVDAGAVMAHGSPLPDKLQVSCYQGGKVYGPNFANGVKVGWRDRMTGITPEQVVRHFRTYFAKLKAAIESHPDADKWDS